MKQTIKNITYCLSYSVLLFDILRKDNLTKWCDCAERKQKKIFWAMLLSALGQDFR